MKKISFILVLTIIFTFSLGTVAFADNKNLTDIVGDIQGAKTVIGDEDGGAKDKILGISRDAMDIVMIGVTAYVVISGLITGGQFAGVGDDSTKKSKLKTKLIFHIGGLVFLANYFGLFDFMFGNMQIFK